MKRIVAAVIFVVVICTACYAEGVVNSGVLTYLGTTESEFQSGLDDLRKALTPLLPADESNWEEEDRLEGFISALVNDRRIIHFYDSLLSMQMALMAKKIDEIALPEAVGIYLITNNLKYQILFSLNMMPSTISFGFKKGNTELQRLFNTAITSMKKDGTLSALESKYIAGFSGATEHVKFQEFKGAPTIRVAVTGDLPPIDYIAADGTPAGYNTAILAEIGRRLRRNIRLISIDAGGRSAALASERADVVFWYRNTEGLKTPARIKGSNLKGIMRDSFDGVILSEPYYEWDVDLIIGRAD